MTSRWQHWERPLWRGFLLVGEAAGPAVARRAVRLIFAGWLPQDRVSSQGPPSRIGRRRAVPAAHRCVTDARREGPARRLLHQLSQAGFHGGFDSRILSWGEETLRGHGTTEEVSR